MPAPFIVKLVLSLIIGGLWITAGVALAERRGPKIGGLVIGFPSTVLIAVVFIGWTQSPLAAVQATTVIPAVHGINCLFVLVAVSLIGQRLWKALACGLALWGGLSSVLIVLKFNNFWVGVLIYAGPLAFSYWRLDRAVPRGSDPVRVQPAGPHLIAARGVLGGTVIALAVLLAKVGGPLIGGVFAIFPAVFTGALLATAISHGEGFSAVLMKSTILGGISVIVFAAAVRLSFVPLGIGYGTLVSTLAPLASTIIIRALTVRKSKQTPA